MPVSRVESKILTTECMGFHGVELALPLTSSGSGDALLFELIRQEVSLNSEDM
jgi:hypothetical protein